jgi:phosphotransferase system IIB component
MKKIFSNLFSALKKVGGTAEPTDSAPIQEDENSAMQETTEKNSDTESVESSSDRNCEDSPPIETDPFVRARCEKWLIALGGRENVVSVDACAATRLRMRLRQLDWLDREELINNGVRGIMLCDGEIIHLVIGFDVSQYELAMQKILAE